jgi:hypothetical protein
MRSDERVWEICGEYLGASHVGRQHTSIGISAHEYIEVMEVGRTNSKRGQMPIKHFSFAGWIIGFCSLLVAGCDIQALFIDPKLKRLCEDRVFQWAGKTPSTEYEAQLKIKRCLMDIEEEYAKASKSLSKYQALLQTHLSDPALIAEYKKIKEELERKNTSEASPSWSENSGEAPIWHLLDTSSVIDPRFASMEIWLTSIRFTDEYEKTEWEYVSRDIKELLIPPNKGS